MTGLNVRVAFRSKKNEKTGTHSNNTATNTMLLSVIVSVCCMLTSIVPASSHDISTSSIQRRTYNEDIGEYEDYLALFDEYNSTNAIVGGSDTDARSYPWFVQFASKVCGGTVSANKNGNSRKISLCTFFFKNSSPKVMR